VARFYELVFRNVTVRRTLAAQRLILARMAYEIGSTVLHAFFVGDAGSATPVEANAITHLEFGSNGRRDRQSVDAMLSIPRTACPNGSAMVPIAKPVATFAVGRAIAVRDVL